MRRIGVLLSSSADDPLAQTLVGALSQGLQELGWVLGRNLRVDYRWAAVEDDRVRRFAAELVAVAPDLVLTFGNTASRAVQRAAPTLPIVFVYTSDPVGSGLVASLGRPGGYATGFLSIEYGTSTKWLELLKQIAPRVSRAAIIRDPETASGAGQPGRHSGGGADIRHGGEPDRRARRHCYRAVRCCLRAWIEGRLDCHDEQIGEAPSRPDNRAGGEVQTSCGLPESLLRRCRRIGRLWTGLHRPTATGRRLCRSHPQG
jgi:hypothetical protein